MSGTIPEVTTAFGADDATGPLPPPSNTSLDLLGLPPQYPTGGGLGFFSRQLKSVLTTVAVGLDNALYVIELSGLPYPEGCSRVWRIADPAAGTEFRPGTPGGTPQVYVSGFTPINGLSLGDEGNLDVLEHVNASAT